MDDTPIFKVKWAFDYVLFIQQVIQKFYVFCAAAGGSYCSTGIIKRMYRKLSTAMLGNKLIEVVAETSTQCNCVRV